MKESEKKDADGMSLKDMLKLGHEVNKLITYGGMNAKEVEEFKEISANQWKKIREDYDKWVVQIRVLNSKVLFVFLILFGVASIYLSGWLKIVFMSIAIYSFFELTKREGHREGYIDGYRDGFDDGINKSLGIDEKEAADIDERAIDMEIDGRLVNKWVEEEDKTKKVD